MSRRPARFAAVLFGWALAACAPEESASGSPAPAPATVPGAAHLTLVRDPGPTPNDETPPTHTLYAREGGTTRVVSRVWAVAPGGAARVEPGGALRIGDAVVDTNVRPGLATAPDGTVAYTRAPSPPASDVWRIRPGGRPERVTTDGRSERPFYLPDGRLLYTSSAGTGRVGWFLEDRRLNSFPEARVPAFPDRTRFEGGRVIFDAGDALYALDVDTGRTERLP
ncbi:hypothetical protein L6V77_06250 [Myxococcota bacterium]|nr:hypothetical protein [Myxococcota bacterium]